MTFKSKFRGLPIVTAIAAAAMLFAPQAALAANPISIVHCFVIVPRPMSRLAGGTQIVYMNNGPKTARSITFVVGYRNAAQHFIRRVIDKGTFSPGQTIDHRFDLYNDVTFAGKETSSCFASTVTWMDGTTWTAQ
ncbi:MAG: hypothetical protein ACLQPV_04275 [Vulcanimicrobiaceae bacterium]